MNDLIGLIDFRPNIQIFTYLDNNLKLNVSIRIDQVDFMSDFYLPIFTGHLLEANSVMNIINKNIKVIETSVDKNDIKFATKIIREIFSKSEEF